MVKQLSKTMMKIFSVFAAVLISSTLLSAQNRPVNGTVMDENGEAIIGAAVLMVGNNTNGVTTDIDGKFTINLPADASIEVSCIGFATQVIKVGNQNNLTVIMITDAEFLDETVVVGYGTQKKATLTGSVATLAGNDVTKSPAANVTATLAGKMPGLIVNQRSGRPGSDDPSISVRGASSFASGTSPLIIIDGVERDNMGRLNPEDIESFSVLKDASAAIYGARAANGVILITTKKGNEGKAVFSFSQNTGFSSIARVPEMLNSYDYAIAHNEGVWYRAGRPEKHTPYYSEEDLRLFQDGSDPIMHPNTNWIKEVAKTAIQTRTSMQVSGGTRDIRYLMSYSYQHQGSNFNGLPDDYKQHNVRLNINAQVNKYLTLGANVSSIIGNQIQSSVGNDTDVFAGSLVGPPTIVARYPNGYISKGRHGENSLALDQRGYTKDYKTPIYSTFTASIKVPYIEGMKVDASFNYDINNSFRKNWVTPIWYYDYDTVTQDYVYTTQTGKAIELRDTYNRSTNMMYNVRLTYDKTFGKNTLSAMFGLERQKGTSSNANAYRKNFLSSALPEINVGSSAAADKDNGGSSSNSARDTYFGRVNYNYSGKYLAELIFRYDGSTNFPAGKRYGFFPAASLGWRISEEPFIKDSMPELDNLKLRFSIGQTGNDRVSAFQYLQTYSFSGNYVFGSTDASGITTGTMPNPNITWEVSTKYDLGLDGSLWKNKLGWELTFFQEHRTGILAARQRSIPSYFGFTSLPSENIGETKNRGVELLLTHINVVSKDFSYKLTGNISTQKSTIIFMDETPTNYEYQAQTGHPIGSQLIYKTDGIFRTKEELDAYPHHNRSQVGDLRIVDLNGDGKINSDDRYRFDYNSTPRTVFGLTADFTYKAFELTLAFQGQTDVYNYDSIFETLAPSKLDNAYYARFNNRWTVDNIDGTMPRSDNYIIGTTDFFLYDATFIRLKNAELAYNMPKKWVSTVGLSNCRLYMSASNLFTWAKEIKWIDPELSGRALFYPQQRVINFGVNIRF